jgi:hypothetical protein
MATIPLLPAFWRYRRTATPLVSTPAESATP